MSDAPLAVMKKAGLCGEIERGNVPVGLKFGGFDRLPCPREGGREREREGQRERERETALGVVAPL